MSGRNLVRTRAGRFLFVGLLLRRSSARADRALDLPGAHPSRRGNRAAADVARPGDGGCGTGVVLRRALGRDGRAGTDGAARLPGPCGCRGRGDVVFARAPACGQRAGSLTVLVIPAPAVPAAALSGTN